MTTLEPHQQRVVDERVELADRLAKLQDFARTPAFAALAIVERMRLRDQAHHMTGYLDVLAARIAAFSAPTGTVVTGEGPIVTDEMVARFLTWPVPADVYPDGTPGQPGRTGTNLLSAPQAKAMLQHVLGG